MGNMAANDLEQNYLTRFCSIELLDGKIAVDLSNDAGRVEKSGDAQVHIDEQKELAQAFADRFI